MSVAFEIKAIFDDRQLGQAAGRVPGTLPVEVLSSDEGVRWGQAFKYLGLKCGVPSGAVVVC